MTNRVAVIGGYGPGLGQGLAEVFLSTGYEVAALSRRGTAHEGALSLSVDLTREEAVSAAIKTVADKLGPADVYIHNVAALHIGPFLETDAIAFETVWQASFLSAVHGTKAVLPAMVEKGAGTILFSGATAAIKGGKNFSAFASAKFALRGLAQSLAREFQPHGIHVAHIILDGLMAGTASVARFGGTKETSIDPLQAAEVYLALVNQGRSAWSQEIDLRPYTEGF